MCINQLSTIYYDANLISKDVSFANKLGNTTKYQDDICIYIIYKSMGIDFNIGDVILCENGNKVKIRKPFASIIENLFVSGDKINIELAINLLK